MSLRIRTPLQLLIWHLLFGLLLAACVASTPAAPVPAIPPVSTEQPGASGVPAPSVTPTGMRSGPLAGMCLARGPFPPLLPGLRYGVNAFLFGTDQQRVLTLTHRASFGWLRQQIHWRDIETQPGHYNWGALDPAIDAAHRAGLHMLISVVRSPGWATASAHGGLPDDPALLGAFMRALAGRYAGRVSAYEIWNEPNLALENGGRPATPAQYLATLQAAFAAVKQADPCALVLAAPLAATATDDPAVAADDLRFYHALYELDGGAFLRAADAVAIHPGGGDHAFDDRWPAGAAARSREYFRHVEEIRALMKRAGDQRQAWITEVGWTTRRVPGAPPPVSPQQQADNLLGALQFTRAAYPWVAAIFVWNLNFAVLGPDSDEKSGFGILRHDWSPQPAYLALQSYLNAQAEAERRALPRFSDSARYQQRWWFRAEGKIHTTTTLTADGTAYIGSDPGHFYALSPAGALRWVFEAPGSTRDAPALGADGTLYLGDGSGALTALRPDGMQIWQQSLGGAVRGTPQIDGDAIYAATASGEALRLGRDGRIVWRVALGAPAAPSLLHGTNEQMLLYVPTESGAVLALSNDGQVRWRADIGRKITSAPALAEDHQRGARLLIGDAEGYVSSLDAATGQLRWQRKLVERIASPSLSPTSSLIAAPPLVGADGTIYLGGRDGRLTALDLAGNTRWRYDSGSDISATPAQAPDGTLYVGLYDQRLVALDPGGHMRWQVRVRGAVRSRPLLAPDGALYVGTVGGILYVFTPTTGEQMP